MPVTRSITYFQQSSLAAAQVIGKGLSKVSSAVIAVGGTGYAKGDVVTVAGGTFLIPTKFRVTQVGAAGVVTLLTKTASGVATTKPSNAAATTVAPSGGTGLTLTLTWADDVMPDGTTSILINAETQNVRWRDDGVDPTAAVGQLLVAGASIALDVQTTELFKVIEVTTSAKLNITFYGA